MGILRRSLHCLTGICLVVTGVFAHPGSGIFRDRAGQLYFVDTGEGIWKLDAEGRLTPHPGPAFHWMALDSDGLFSKTRLPSSPTGELRAVGADPTLILSSDFPITLGSDGDLYYPELGPDERLRLIRLTPSGSRTVYVTLPATTDGRALRWLNGMAAGPDGSIYYTEDEAVRKVDEQGRISTLVSRFTVSECAPVPGAPSEGNPYLRGLDVASDGAVFVAASGCGALLRISSDGEATPVLRATSPWSPTAVAVAGDELFVLEYLHTDSDDRSEWRPRVRRVSSDGEVTTIASVERQ